MSSERQRVLVTGGAGYIGARLVPELLATGREVTVFDRLIFGASPLHNVRNHPHLRIVRGDLRSAPTVDALLHESDFDAVIHLAAISNDPSSELDPAVTEAVNGAATQHLMRTAHAAGVRRFLYASSASVYGIKQTPDVTEDLPLDPITLYAKMKADGEVVLNSLASDDFVGVSVRSATVCGTSPRLRLDLTINILTDHALRRGAIRVFGGSQMRPNVHISDLTRFYTMLLDADPALVNGQAFNVSRENASVLRLAEMIQDQIDASIPIEVVETDDKRSYHLSAERARTQLGFSPEVPLGHAVEELVAAYRAGHVSNPDDDWYRNVKWMQAHPETWRSSDLPA